MTPLRADTDELLALLESEPGNHTVRAVAIAARSELEDAVRDYFATFQWRPHSPRYGEMFRVLRSVGYPSPSEAREMHAIWCRLSSSCHHRVSTLAPNADEVRRLVVRMRALAASLQIPTVT